MAFIQLSPEPRWIELNWVPTSRLNEIYLELVFHNAANADAIRASIDADRQAVHQALVEDCYRTGEAAAHQFAVQRHARNARLAAQAVILVMTAKTHNRRTTDHEHA